MEIKVSLLGFGNVGQQLYQAFRGASGFTLVQVYNRTWSALKDLEGIEKTDRLEAILEADVYILCVKDEAIPLVAAAIPYKNKLVAHTSGALPKTAISQVHRRGAFYPVQSFSKYAHLDFSRIPLAVSAENTTDLDTLKAIGGNVFGHIFEISDAQKTQLHLAAVFANNFVNELYATAEDICRAHNLPFDILRPLITETAQKIQKNSPTEAQTGPALRNDRVTIENHIRILKSQSLKELYTHFTKKIQARHGQETV